MERLTRLLFFPVTFATLVLIFFVLMAWEQLLLPLVMAIVIWYLIVTLANAVGRSPLLGPRLPNFLCYLLAFAICFGAAWLVLTIVRVNVTRLVQNIPSYQARFSVIIAQWWHFWGVEQPPDLSELIGRFDFMTLATSMALLARDLAQNGGVIIIYVMFLLLEHHLFDAKLQALIPDPEKLASARDVIQQIATQIQSYLRIKSFTSLLTAVICFTILRIAGVDFAEFWALIIFILNFIPTIGSILATLFPCALALVQFDTFTPFVIVTLALVATQIYVGNILEPRLMGKTFNLSGLVIILSLALWGKVWGIIGMFLCVPIMVILNIILANFSSTRPIAMLLSQDGQLKEP